MSIYLKRFCLLALLAVLAIIFDGCKVAQQLKSVDIKGKSKELYKKMFDNQTVSTSIFDANTEVELFGNFDTALHTFSPFNSMKVDADKNYVARPGRYAAWLKSFCLHPGTYGPNTGDGYLFAELAGTKGFIIQSILKNWQTKHPEINQRQVQLLIWAIIDQPDISQINNAYKINLAKLLDKNTYMKLLGSAALDIAKRKVVAKLQSKAPDFVRKTLEAQIKMKELFKIANAAYEQFERYAVLTGPAPESANVKRIGSGSWSYHKAGYFIRFFPRSYTRTRVDIYVPETVHSVIDNMGRLQMISKTNSPLIKFIYDDIQNGKLKSIRYVSKKNSLEVMSPLFPAGFGATSVKYEEFLTENALKWKTKLNDLLDGTTMQDGSKEKVRAIQAAKNEILNMGTNQLSSSTKSGLAQILDEASNYQIFTSFSSSGPPPSGLIDLSGNVAVPGNTARQRIGIANDPMPDQPSVTAGNLTFVKATTEDAKSVVVDYEVSDSSLHSVTFSIYRSASCELNGTQGIDFIKIGEKTINTNADLSTGNHSKVKVLSNTPLLPDTRLPFVVVVADYNGQTSLVYFRKFILGAISHGFDRFAMDRGWFWEHTFQSYDLPEWERKMAGTLLSTSQYDHVITFDWMHSCAIENLLAATEAGAELALSVSDWIEANRLHEGDVVDIHLIGHSRGTVVVTQAAKRLLEGTLKSFTVGSYFIVTLLDPHPANNDLQKIWGSWGTFNNEHVYNGGCTFQGIGEMYFAKKMTTAFQNAVKDVPVYLPLGLHSIDVWWQTTNANLLCTQPYQEYIQNLWGMVIDKSIQNHSGLSLDLNAHHFVDRSIPGIGYVGHNEVPLVYLKQVVESGLLNRSP